MSKRLQITAVLFAWLIATGTQWDLVQVVAWGRMFLEYSRTMDFAAAAKKTFGGEMCGLCKAVSEARQQEKSQPAPGSSKPKLAILCPSAPEIFWSAPDAPSWSLRDSKPQGAARPAPPTPPPRSHAV